MYKWLITEKYGAGLQAWYCILELYNIPEVLFQNYTYTRKIEIWPSKSEDFLCIIYYLSTYSSDL